MRNNEPYSTRKSNRLALKVGAIFLVLLTEGACFPGRNLFYDKAYPCKNLLLLWFQVFEEDILLMPNTALEIILTFNITLRRWYTKLVIYS